MACIYDKKKVTFSKCKRPKNKFLIAAVPSGRNVLEGIREKLFHKLNDPQRLFARRTHLLKNSGESWKIHLRNSAKKTKFHYSDFSPCEKNEGWVGLATEILRKIPRGNPTASLAGKTKAPKKGTQMFFSHQINLSLMLNRVTSALKMKLSQNRLCFL